MTGHMPMITQKLSKIFHFFDLVQISDMCSFGVSIGFFPSFFYPDKSNEGEKPYAHTKTTHVWNLVQIEKAEIIYSDITVVSGIMSHMEMMGHMPMITQKLSEIFHFFDSDQISDMCSFGVSIGFLPLIRIIWIKECLFWRFEENLCTFD